MTLIPPPAIFGTTHTIPRHQGHEIRSRKRANVSLRVMGILARVRGEAITLGVEPSPRFRRSRFRGEATSS